MVGNIRKGLDITQQASKSLDVTGESCLLSSQSQILLSESEGAHEVQHSQKVKAIKTNTLSTTAANTMVNKKKPEIII